MAMIGKMKCKVKTNLLSIDNVHDDSSLQHLRETTLLDEGRGGCIALVGILDVGGWHDC